MRISIEGIRGSGKTALLKLLGQVHYQIHTVNTKEETIWNDLYQSDQERYSFGLNLYLFLQQVNQAYHPHEIHLFENSPYTLQEIWSHMLLQKNHIHPEEIKLQREIIDKWGWEPDCIIYLDCDPEVCLARLRSHLSEDECPDPEEMSALAQQYDWSLDYSNCNIPVYRVNANDNIINVFYHVLQILYQIRRHVSLSINKRLSDSLVSMSLSSSTSSSSPSSSSLSSSSLSSASLLSSSSSALQTMSPLYINNNFNPKSPLYSLLLKKTAMLQRILEEE